MNDFRHCPEESPFAWCPYRQELIQVTPSIRVMKTVFYVHPTGIYPYVNSEATVMQAVS